MSSRMVYSPEVCVCGHERTMHFDAGTACMAILRQGRNQHGYYRRNCICTEFVLAQMEEAVKRRAELEGCPTGAP